jgi:hypothetical protein
MWRTLLALAAVLIVCAAVVSLISDEDWARITSFILGLLGVLVGAAGVYRQRGVTW